jgi:uncharacterized membrane protein YphA (DoxX/SURF4 family)
MADIQPPEPPAPASDRVALWMGQARHILSLSGGILLALGLTAEHVASFDAIAGAVLALLAALWSAHDKLRGR